MTARSRAAQIVAQVLAGESLSGLFNTGIQSLPEQQQPLCRELVYGTLREWPRLSALLQSLLQKPLKDKDADIQALLAIGIYQLGHLRIPPHAAVSETVGSVNALKKGWAKGLVNGVLRNYQRRAETLEAGLPAAARDALPAWLHGMLGNEWPDDLSTIAAASRTRPPMFLRANVLLGQREAALMLLNEAGIPADPHPTVASAVRLAEPTDVANVPGFYKGQFSVQDASAQLAAILLDPRAGERILDACAAPGGKAGHIAELLANQGANTETLVAADVSADRLLRIEENRDRLGLPFKVVACDARQPTTVGAPESYDAILADVPCSATGVLRRNPDVKVIRTAGDIRQFSALQREILSGLWPLLKPGGRLIYVTCSLLSAENDDIVGWALGALTGASIAALAHPLARPTQWGIQCLPTPTEGDGLYYAQLFKTPLVPA